MTVNEAIETLRYEIDEECHCDYIADEIHLLIEELEKKDIEIDILIRKKETLRDEIQELTESVKEFAKFIIDKSETGIIYAMDIPDYVIEFKERTGVKDA